MRLAAIDLGTNTVRLLVVDARAGTAWTVLDASQRVTRLGDGVVASGRLQDAPMARTATVVAEYATRAVQAGAEPVLIVATSAVREAANGPAFATRLEALTGHRVRIISGEEEARLALLGVSRGLGALTGAVVVFDVGGGSTEFVRAREGRIEASVSLRLGVVPLAEGAGDYPQMAREAARHLGARLPAAVGGGGVDQLVGTAGTVTTLAALDLGLHAYDPSRVHGHTLTRAAIERQRDRLLPLTTQEIAALPCLEPGRADLIRPGIAIVLAVMDVLGVDRLRVSEWGLREGIMAEALDACC